MGRSNPHHPISATRDPVPHAFRVPVSSIRDGLEISALLTLAFFAWLGTGVAHGALAVLALLTFTTGRQGLTSLLRDPMVRLFALFTIYLLASAVAAEHRWPETARNQWHSVWPWISLWMFLPVAWCLRCDPRRIYAVLVAAPFGLIAGILRRSEWSHLPQWLAGERYEFGYTSLGVSLLSLVIVLGLVTLAPRILNAAVSTGMRSAIATLWLLELLFFLFVLLVAQSRGVWLGLAIALPMAGMLALWIRRPKDRSKTVATRGTVGATLATAAALGAIAWQFGGTIAGRWQAEADVLPGLMGGHESDIPYSPIGARIHLSLWGLRLIARHPWFGYGPGADAPHHLLPLEFGSASSGFLSVIGHFVHLHNAYLEVLLRFGLAGAALLVAALVVFHRAIIRARLSGRLHSDFFVFGLTVSFAVLLFGFYEFRLLHTDFRFLSMLFGGAFYTYALHGPRHED